MAQKRLAVDTHRDDRYREDDDKELRSIVISDLSR
jgi:hypothetical protein